MPKKDLYIRTYKIMFAEYPDVVNVKEVSRMLGIGRDKVYKLVKTGSEFRPSTVLSYFQELF